MPPSRFRIGEFVFPLPTLLAFAAAVLLTTATHFVLQRTFAGRALRAFAEDRTVAAAFGIDHRRLGVAARRRRRRHRGGRRPVVGAEQRDHTGDTVRLVRDRVRRGHPRGNRERRRHAPRRGADRDAVERRVGRVVTGGGAARPVLGDHPGAAVPAPRPPHRWRRPVKRGPRRHRRVAIALLAVLPFVRESLGLTGFYIVILYTIFFWTAQATSWNVLSGYAGYFSFGQGAFVGVGAYTAAVLSGRNEVDYFVTIPVAGALGVMLALAIGAVAFRLRSFRGEIFALLTLAVPFILASIARLNTRIDGGQGIIVPSPEYPDVLGDFQDFLYLLNLAIAGLAVGIALRNPEQPIRVGARRCQGRRGRRRRPRRADVHVQDVGDRRHRADRRDVRGGVRPADRLRHGRGRVRADDPGVRDRDERARRAHPLARPGDRGDVHRSPPGSSHGRPASRAGD